MTGTRRQLQIGRWTPEDAKREIERLWADSSLDEASRAMLARFATYSAMHSVWDGLRHEPAGIAGFLITHAVYARMIFPTLRPQR
jgi:hypothetical protein